MNRVPVRLSSSARGYDHAWRRFRLAYLAEHPTCIDCERNGVVTAATQVDHEPRLRGPNDPGRLDPRRCRACCASCHSRKTCRQDGGRPQ